MKEELRAAKAPKEKRKFHFHFSKRLLIVALILGIIGASAGAFAVSTGVISIDSNAESLKYIPTPSLYYNITIQNVGLNTVTLLKYEVTTTQTTNPVPAFYFQPKVVIAPGQSSVVIYQSASNETLHITTERGHIFTFTLIHWVPPSSNIVPKEGLNIDSSTFTNSTEVVMYIRNSGSVNISLVTYYVKDSTGNQWSQTSWVGPTIQSNTAPAAYIEIGPNSGATLSGTSYGFVSGNSYTITVVTARSNQFSWTIAR